MWQYRPCHPPTSCASDSLWPGGARGWGRGQGARGTTQGGTSQPWVAEAMGQGVVGGDQDIRTEVRGITLVEVEVEDKGTILVGVEVVRGTSLVGVEVVRGTTLVEVEVEGKGTTLVMTSLHLEEVPALVQGDRGTTPVVRGVRREGEVRGTTLAEALKVARGTTPGPEEEVVLQTARAPAPA